MDTAIRPDHVVRAATSLAASTRKLIDGRTVGDIVGQSEDPAGALREIASMFDAGEITIADPDDEGPEDDGTDISDVTDQDLADLFDPSLLRGN